MRLSSLERLLIGLSKLTDQDKTILMVPRHTGEHLSCQFPCLPQSPMGVKRPAKVEQPETEQRGGTVVGQDMTLLDTTEMSVWSQGDSSAGEGTSPASLVTWVQSQGPT